MKLGDKLKYKGNNPNWGIFKGSVFEVTLVEDWCDGYELTELSSPCKLYLNSGEIFTFFDTLNQALNTIMPRYKKGDVLQLIDNTTILVSFAVGTVFEITSIIHNAIWGGDLFELTARSGQFGGLYDESSLNLYLTQLNRTPIIPSGTISAQPLPPGQIQYTLPATGMYTIHGNDSHQRRRVGDTIEFNFVKPKCECGAHKTYGVNCGKECHAHFCDLSK